MTLLERAAMAGAILALVVVGLTLGYSLVVLALFVRAFL